MRTRSSGTSDSSGRITGCGDVSGWTLDSYSDLRRLKRIAVNLSETDATLVSIIPLERSSVRIADSLRGWPGPLGYTNQIGVPSRSCFNALFSAARRDSG